MIEKAIHEIINDASIPDAVSLLALLPANRIVTGTKHLSDLPYANLNLESNVSGYRSNTGSARRYLLRFQVWHAVHATGRTIAEALEKLFENKSFTTTSQVLKVSRHENTFAIQEDDGTWQINSTFEITATPV